MLLISRWGHEVFLAWRGRPHVLPYICLACINSALHRYALESMKSVLVNMIAFMPVSFSPESTSNRLQKWIPSASMSLKNPSLQKGRERC
jgi:hypothetical protein